MKKRKIGDIIHFMADNKVMSKEIKGISTFEGVVVCLNTNHKLDLGEIKTFYHYGDYDKIDSTLVFDSEDELKESLFPKVKEVNDSM